METVNGDGLMPDEGDIVFNKGVRRIDGRVVLCHLRFVSEVVAKMKVGGGMSNALVAHIVVQYVCDDTPAPWEGDVIFPLRCWGAIAPYVSTDGGGLYGFPRC